MWSVRYRRIVAVVVTALIELIAARDAAAQAAVAVPQTPDVSSAASVPGTLNEPGKSLEPSSFSGEAGAAAHISGVVSRML